MLLGLALGTFFVLLLSLRGIAAFYTDTLWFGTLDLGAVWWRFIGTKAGLATAGALIFFVLCWANLAISERLAPSFRTAAGDDDLIERYHEVVGERAWMVRAGVSLFLAIFIGASLGAYWNEWVLFTNRVDFGEKDATFATDIGFYVFQLPFLSVAGTWLFSSLVVILIATLLAHVVNGGIRFHSQVERVTPQVKAHVSVLLGVLALVQMGRYWLGRYELVFSTSGTVDGATYTAVNVQLRAIYLLMMIALFAFGLFIANIWRRGWVLPVMAVGLWALVAVLAGVMVPAFVQRFRVQPTESSVERVYIEHNIAATRQAYGLGEVEERPYDWTGELDAQTINENLGTMRNVRLWDVGTVQDSFSVRQELRPYYGITDVDVDRYEIDGELTEVMVASRDLNTEGIQRPSWEATHLIYTNGNGVVASTANDKVASGDPPLVARDIPVQTSRGMPEVEQPRLYFGEDKSGYVIVNTDVRDPEADDEGDAEAVVTRYDGADGIEVGSGVSAFLRKAAFSLRFGDIDPLVSGSIRPDSRVLIERDVTDRLKKVAPFLAYGHDPYVVVVDGRLKYVVDGYTTSRNFPNAQRADTGGLSPRSGLYGRSFNYVRNSVKAVVDGYDGSVELYVIDEDEPMIRAYRKAFPELFSPWQDAPADLLEHVRYPEDLFTVQTQMWTRYHVDDPDDFYNGRDNWAVPRDTGATQQTGSATVELGPDGQELTSDDRYPSQFLLMQLPGERNTRFVLLRPYVTANNNDADGGQNQLRAFMVASSDPETYGQLLSYAVETDDLPDGPNLAADDMKAEADVAARIRSLCNERTICTFAAPSIVPVADSLLYVQSFFVSGSEQGAPKLEHVIVNYRRPGGDSEVVIDTSLRGALVQLFGEEVSTEIQGGAGAGEPEPAEPAEPSDPDGEGEEPEEPADEGTVAEREAELIDRLVAAFDEADAAARAGDLVGREEKLAEAVAIAEELQALRDEIDGASAPQQDGETSGAPPEDPQTTTTTTAGA